MENQKKFLKGEMIYMNMEKEIIVFGFNEAQKDKLSKICSDYDAIIKIVEKDNVGNKIDDIINGNIASAPVNEEEFNAFKDEKLILFHNFGDEELNKIIKDIRINKELSCILAVVTPTSIEWEFKYLLEHLVEEREWFKKNNK
ncbi:DUF3783 domain-containing protein [Hathewaya massiliensis]|uniref:DUF3783 domain-containing protein n=1 Tax=Hathewaya massiliensis TaxID=1964382 RepID=UPI001158EE11|nr:DUF3783 domain-containing protein [Hathewaya massiliensis]